MPGGGPGTGGVQSLGTVTSAHPFHPEAKRCGSDGAPCAKRTSGVLRRRPVHAAGQVCIGKEAHKLEERDLASGLEGLQSVFTDPRREPWISHVLPRLRMLTAEPEARQAMLKASGLLPRALRNVLAGRSQPRPSARIRLTEFVHNASKLGDRHCAGCDGFLETPVPRRRYCSTRCRQRAKRQRAVQER